MSKATQYNIGYVDGLKKALAILSRKSTSREAIDAIKNKIKRVRGE